MIGHTGPVISLLVLPNGNLASGSRDKTIRIWDVKSGQTTKILSEHNNWVLSLAILPDGTLVSGDGSETIIFWNLNSGQKIFKFVFAGIPINDVRALLVLPDGNLACGLRGWIGIFDTKNRKIIKRFDGHSSFVNSLGLLPDGRLASASNDNTLRIIVLEY